MLRVFASLLGLFLWFGSFTVVADSPKLPVKDKVNSDLTDLIALLEKIETISGSFIQYSVDQKGTTIQESRGQFKAKRPDYFYWRTDAPLEQEIFADSNKITVYDPDLEQATVQPNEGQAQHTPAVLFSGDPALISESYLVKKQSAEGSMSQFLLTPQSPDSLFEKMRLRFEGASLTELRIRDSLGQESTISFVHTEVNSEIPASAFVPSLPEDTDIIEDLTPRQPSS